MKDEAQVELTPVTTAHTDAILRWRADPDVASEMFSARPPTREEHLAWLATLGEKRREFVILALPERVPVGTIGLSQIDHVHGNGEYGVLLGEPAYRGRGYASAASRLLLQMAFAEWGLHRVSLRVRAHNERALRLYESMGFRPEGVLREQARCGTGYEDVVIMGLLESEWRTRA